MPRRLVFSAAVVEFDDPEYRNFGPRFTAVRNELIDVLRSEPFKYENVSMGSPIAHSQDLGQAVTDILSREELTPADCLIVHLLTHGIIKHGDLHALGKDCRTPESATLNSWAKTLHKRNEPGPAVLFLLDFCSSGLAVPHEMLARTSAVAEGDVPADIWIWCATGAYDETSGARFTESIVEVLRAAAKTGMASAAQQEWISLARLFQFVRESHPIAIKSAEPAGQACFFRNRYFSPVERQLSVEEPDLRSMVGTLDSIVDPLHFHNRAQAVGPSAPWGVAGLFQGREEELTSLYSWATDTGTPPVMVLKGRAGCGKSALLGMFVCGVHPRLRDLTRHLFQRHDRILRAQLTSVIVIHARQQSRDAVVRSIARQATPSGGGLDARPSAADVAAYLGTLREPPLLVVDAIDESVDPVGVAGLLSMLATEERADAQGNVCRLLVAGRPIPALDKLVVELGSLVSECLDLDMSASADLVEPLERYVDSLLERRFPGIGDLRTRTEVSRMVAQTLTAADLPRTDCGEFLIAGLYARWLAGKEALDPVGPDDVPRDLPAALERDLEASHYTTWLRPVMAATAFGLGSGLSMSSIQDLAPAFHPDGAKPTSLDILVALDDARPYLRQAADGQEVVYRLFHSALSEHLTLFPTSADQEKERAAGHGAIVDRMRERAAAHGWLSRDRYLVRYAAEHAHMADRLDELIFDAEFLVFADPDHLARVLSGRSNEAAAIATLYSTYFNLHRHLSYESRRLFFGIQAARHGLRELALSVGAGPAIEVSWATGRPLRTVESLVLSTDVRGTSCTVFETADGTIVGVVGDCDGVLRQWSLLDSRSLAEPYVAHRGAVTALTHATSPDGTTIIVSGGWDGQVKVWEPLTGRPLGPPRQAHDKSVRDIRTPTDGNGALAATCSWDGRVKIAALLSEGLLPIEVVEGSTAEVQCLCFLPDSLRTVLFTGGWDGAVRRWDPPGDEESGAYSTLEETESTFMPREVVGLTAVYDQKLIVAEVNGGLYALPIDLSGRPHALTDGLGAIRSMASDGDSFVVVGGDDGLVHSWDVRHRTAWREPLVGHRGTIRAVSCVQTSDGPIAISASDDGTVRRWQVGQRVESDAARSGHTNDIIGLVTARLDDHDVAITADDGGEIRVWRLLDGETIRRLFVPGRRQVRALTQLSHDETLQSIAVATDEGILVWGVRDMEVVADRLRLGWERKRAAVAPVWIDSSVSVDGRPLLIGAGSSEIKVWDGTTFDPLATFGLKPDEFWLGSTMIDGQAAFLTQQHELLRHRDQNTGKILKSRFLHEKDDFADCQFLAGSIGTMSSGVAAAAVEFTRYKETLRLLDLSTFKYFGAEVDTSDDRPAIALVSAREDRDLLVSCGRLDGLEVRDPRTGKLIVELAPFNVHGADHDEDEVFERGDALIATTPGGFVVLAVRDELVVLKTTDSFASSEARS